MKYLLISILFFLLVSCTKYGNIESTESALTAYGRDTDTSIFISDKVILEDREKIRDTIFNYTYYEKFIRKLVNSNRFIFVPLKEFNTTFSSDKIVIALRHDVDYDIAAAVRFARREFNNGVRATYFFLNTAKYYGVIRRDTLIRNPNLLLYMKKLQNEYKHEIGWHNDLVTMQIVYNFDVKRYLTSELAWLRNNGIKIDGSAYHGSKYCHEYLYLNSYLWKNSKKNNNFPCFDSVLINGTYKKIHKFDYSDFGLQYEAEGTLKCNYFFADVFFINNKRWNMSMFDWNTLKPGDRVIILTHAGLWDSHLW